MSWYVYNPFSTGYLVFVVTTVFSVSHCRVVYGFSFRIPCIAYRSACFEHFITVSGAFFFAIAYISIAMFIYPPSRLYCFCPGRFIYNSYYVWNPDFFCSIFVVTFFCYPYFSFFSRF